MFDILIRGGLVADGSGAPLFRADVAVQAGKIVRIAPEIRGDAKEVLDADGCIVCPGFIDAHSHNDETLLCSYDEARVLCQGITSEITGNCGGSTAPYAPGMYTADMALCPASEMEPFVRKGGSFADFIEVMKEKQQPVNAGFLVGHCTLRCRAMGFDNRRPTPAEMESMKADLREALEAGALGLSSGLIYPPGCYAENEELVELAKVAAEYPNSIYASHMRNESYHVVQSVKDTLALGREANIAVQISHHKVMGRMNAGLSRETLRLVSEARAKGQKVTLDAYPYDGGCTALINALPPQHADQGTAALVEKLRRPEFREQVRKELEEQPPRYENLILFSGMDRILIIDEDHPSVSGKTIAQLAQEDGKDPYDEIFDLIVESGGNIFAIFRLCSESDMENILRYSATMVGTDALPSAESKPFSHPRGQAAFPYFLATFCRDNGWLSIEDGIRKVTGLPADTFGLSGKGYIREGLDADIVVFDYEKLAGPACYGHGDMPNRGFRAVYVNGVLSVKDDMPTGLRGGKLLLRGASE